MEKDKMKLLGLDDILGDYEIPEIESVEENVMKAISQRKMKPKRVQIIIAPVIGYLVSSILFAIFYSRNALFAFVWNVTGAKIISFIHSVNKIGGIVSAFLPPFKAEYLIVPITGMLIISIGAMVMEKKNKKKGGNK
jgi:hypothetical protein